MGRRGNCYAASEALYHFLGGKASGWKPMVVRHEGGRECASNLYGTGETYPSPHALADECLRVLAPGGRLGFMHHMVPKFRKPGRLLKVYAITQGLGYNVRAWTLLTKDNFLTDSTSGRRGARGGRRIPVLMDL